jgi:pyridoxamine 5'-phosphate oxidase
MVLARIMFVVSELVPLREEDVDPDPLRQFAVWFRGAANGGVTAPEAVALATASTAGAPSVRMVLMKQYDERGFVFFSSYESRKGRELATNPRVALLFYWELVGRQVRIEGATERTTFEESMAYVRSRPRASQLSALASPQSRTIDSREVLEQRVAQLAARHEGADLPAPDAWGGFRVVPESYEFWQRREDRLHDRLRYTRGDGGRWGVQRLAP